MAPGLGLGLGVHKNRFVGGDFTGLLDQPFASGATAAYSLRKLRKDFGAEGAAGPDLSLTNNGVTQTSGQVGNAGLFESANSDYLQGGTDEEFQPDTAMTFEAWVYLTDQSTERTIASNYNGGDGVGWELSVGSGGNLHAYAHDGGSFINPNGGNVPTNTWTHVALRWDGSTLELFVDATSVASEAISTIAPSSRDWLIGNTQGPGGLWEGKIGPARLWNGRNLTNSEISKLYNNGNGLSFSDIDANNPSLLDDLVAAYEFEDSNNLGKDTFILDGPVIRVRRDTDDVERHIGFDGEELDVTALSNFANNANVYVVVWYDQSGNNNDASNSTASQQPKIYDANNGLVKENGKPALDFDGSDDYLDVGTGVYSVSESIVNHFAVLSLNSTFDRNKYLIGTEPKDDGYLHLYDESNEELRIATIRNNLNVENGQTVSTNQHLVYMLADRSSLKGYLNGQLDIDTTDDNSDFTGNHMLIGAGGDNSNNIPANVQEIIFYTSNKKTDRSKFETNINSFYSIY